MVTSSYMYPGGFLLCDPLLVVGLVIQRRYPALLWEVNLLSHGKQCRGLEKRDFWSQIGFRGVEAPTNFPHPTKNQTVGGNSSGCAFLFTSEQAEEEGRKWRNFILLGLIPFKSIISTHFQTFHFLSCVFSNLSTSLYSSLLLVPFNHLPTMLLMITHFFFFFLNPFYLVFLSF